MATPRYQTYEEASQAYLAQFQALVSAPPEASVARRGTAAVPAETLVEQAETFTEISAQMVPLATHYLELDDSAAREGISAQLIAQAAAELQLTHELLERATADDTGHAAAGTRRSASGADLRNAVAALEQVLGQPVAQGLAPAVARPRAGATPTTAEEARQVLQQTANQALDTIAQQVRELGGDIAFDLITATKWGAVIEGARLLREDIGARLESIKAGIGALFTRAVTVVIKTLLNVYDKVLALLGKDRENKARSTIQKWLQQIEQGQQIELFDTLIDRLYQIERLKQELAGRLAAATASVETVNQTSAAVASIAARFVVLSGRLRMVQSTANLGKLTGNPQVLLAVASIQVAVLAISVYAGYDYIGHAQGRLLDLTKGVAQAIDEQLGIAV